MTSFSLDPTLSGLIGQFWTWVMADREIQTYTQTKQPLDKIQNFARTLPNTLSKSEGKKEIIFWS